MFEYGVYENDTLCYKTNDINHAIHEMLSIIGINKTKSYILKHLLTNDSKRFPIVESTIDYFGELREDCEPLNEKLSNYNLNLLFKMKSLTRQKNLPYTQKQHTDINSKTTEDKNNMILDLINKNPNITTLYDKDKKIPDVLGQKQKEAELRNIKKEIEDEENNNTIDDDSDDDLSSQINDKITQLTEQKKELETSLEITKEDHRQQLDNFTEFNSDVNGNKMLARVIEDKKKERVRIFEADKQAYFKMVDAGVPYSKISLLFKQKYPIYDFMYENIDLDTDYDYDLYTYVFSNIYPRSSDELEAKHLFTFNNSEKEKLYAEFIEKEKKKTIRSYDDITEELSDMEKKAVLDGNFYENSNLKNIKSIFESKM